MLYAFDAQDVARLRKLLIAYEQGSLRLSPPRQYRAHGSRQDVILGHITATIAAGQTGNANLVDVDSSSPPVLSDDTNLPAIFPVLNPYTSTLATGYYVLAREPTQGYYIPANVGGGGGGTTIQWVKVTDNTPQTITIGGTNNTAYKAVLTSFSGSWNDTTTFAWFLSANGDTPTVSNRYRCTSFGTAGDTNAVWGEDVVGEKTYIKVTSLTSSNVTLEGTATTITCYPAAISTWKNGVWTDGGAGSVWYYSPNGAVPGLNYRYECLPFAVDNTGPPGKTIWGDDFATPATPTNWGVVTTVAQEFAGDKRFDGSVGVGTAANGGISGFTVPSPNLGTSHGLIVYGDSPGLSTNALLIEKSSLGTGAFIGISDLGGINKSQSVFAN